MDSRYYPGVEVDIPQLTSELRNLFDEDYEVQTIQVSSTSVLQARKSSTLRDLTGLSAALTIRVTPEAGGTRVGLECRSGSTRPQWRQLLCYFPLGYCWRFRRSEPIGNTESLKMPGSRSKHT